MIKVKIKIFKKGSPKQILTRYLNPRSIFKNRNSNENFLNFILKVVNNRLRKVFEVNVTEPFYLVSL
jgi:hypothetical protein